MNVTYLKIRNQVVQNSRIVYIVLGVLIILSIAWTTSTVFEYTDDQYEEVEVVASSYTHSANYDYIAPVTLSNPLYAKGEILDSEHPAYFLSVSPTMDVFFTYALESTDPVQLDIDCDTFLIASSSGNVGAEEKVFWQKVYPVSTTPLKNGEDGEFSYEFSLDIPEIQSKVKDVQDDIGYSQGTAIEVVTYVKYDGKVDGKNIKGVEEFSMPLVISSSYYQIPGDLEFRNTVENYETMYVKRSPSISGLLGPILSYISVMVMILLLGMVRKQGMVPSSHIRRLEVEVEYTKFNDFISKGAFPAEAVSMVEVNVASLQDLVDAAMDMDARVIHDPQKNIYFMIHSGIIYRFDNVHSVYDIAEDEAVA
ncbi:DUF5305 family protein [Methanococcoides sp. FTZ1]|uniref:DUF5305 family protein n=1 Tax=Methanococcoides sp. FTZ1 TaxID=3439061 RepID=UPI003F87BC35